MNLRKSATIAVLALVLSGCGLLPRTHPEEYTIRMSDHTLQELCDFPRNFFTTRYGLAELKVGVAATMPMTRKIGTGNGCSYAKADGSGRPYLGSVSLFLITDSSTTPSTPSPTTDNSPARVLTVDGVTVRVVTEPLPDWADPATSQHMVNFSASLDGWKGDLDIGESDEQTTRAGAQLVVDMIRTLKD